MAEAGDIIVERNNPKESHPLITPEALREITEQNLSKQEVVPLVTYLKEIAGKPRGSQTYGKEDLNSHKEELIIKEGEEIKVTSLPELQEILTSQGLNIEILGVQSIGNPNQKVEAVVQGVNRDNPKSGFERPVVSEGPHMILAPYAIDSKGELHLFRTIQMRTGEAVIDTPRGFADAKALEGGQQMYDIEGAGEKVSANMKRIVGEESGDALKIKRVRFLGAPRVNSAFVTSKSAIFGVEVDYDAFVKNSKLVSEEELQRRKDQFEHEGLVNDVLDITLSQYIEGYKNNPEVSKDMAADFGTDTVVMDFLAKKLGSTKRSLSELGQMRRAFKKKEPGKYVQHMTIEAKYRHPEKATEIDKRAQRYLSKLYKPLLRRVS